MQFKYYLTDNGHVVVRINPKMLKRMRIKLKKLRWLVNNHDTTFGLVERMFNSWFFNYKKYMSKQQYENIVRLYN